MIEFQWSEKVKIYVKNMYLLTEIIHDRKLSSNE